MSKTLIEISRHLTKDLKPLRFKAPITHIYNPLDYARAPHEEYLKRYARRGRTAVLLGMNPGPFGMAQTGVPFGEVGSVRDWLRIEKPVKRPRNEHPKRPVRGFDCSRSEVSGARLWGWARERFESPKKFFEQFFIVNYCPLVFMEESGKNVTPDKCRREERERLYAVCDEALRRTIEYLRPQYVIGIGNFAATRAQEALEGLPIKLGKMLHPSPQSPAANRGWAEAAECQLRELGVLS